MASAALVAAAVVIPVVHVIRGEVLFQEGVLLLPPFRRLRRFFRLFLVFGSRGAALTRKTQLASSEHKKCKYFFKIRCTYVSQIQANGAYPVCFHKFTGVKAPFNKEKCKKMALFAVEEIGPYTEKKRVAIFPSPAVYPP